jgi:superfamily II DNA/RNA helicase
MYPVVTADLIATLSPRLSIVFVPTKADTETVAAFLSNKLSSSSSIVRVLHGDMAQSQRSRTIALIRESEHKNQNQILVATDVASRGLDLPNVDLVVQFGIPRVAGKMEPTTLNSIPIEQDERAVSHADRKEGSRILFYSTMLRLVRVNLSMMS